MALVNFSRVALTKLTNKSCLGAVGSVRNHWNKDFKPAPFPETQKEREAAAKKYAMPADKYEPYPDDGLGYGDYPKLPNTSVDLRDPYYPYDYPEFRRNFNDPMHVETDLYSEDRYSTARQRYPMSTYWSIFFGLMTFWFVLYFWLDNKKMFRPVKPKSFPRDGKPHYTFVAE